MKGKSITMTIGGIIIGIFAYSLFKQGDVLYGVATALCSLALLYFGLIRNKHKHEAYQNVEHSVSSSFNLSGSEENNKNKNK